MKRVISLFTSLVLLLSLFSLSEAEVSASETVTDEMQEMIDKGIMAGYEDGTFKPDVSVTRGQFATFLYRALKLEEGPAVFKDVKKGSSLEIGINAAAKAGLVTGVSADRFAPDAYISRNEMATMIARTLDYMKVPAKSGKLTFLDNDEIGNKSAAMRMVGHGIIQGAKVEGGYVFNPKDNAKRKHAASFISRMLKAAEKENELFVIGTVTSGGTINKTSKAFKTFAEAKAEFDKQTYYAIMQGDKVLAMHEGMVYAAATNGGETILYRNSGSIYGGIQQGSEMEYISASEDKVKIQIGDEQLYVNQSDVKLVPNNKERSYYQVDSGNNLLHYTYNGVTEKYNSPYSYGKASGGMIQGVKYYSWDGQTFTDTSGNIVGTSRQYFNMLPYRTTTQYTAAELDKMIMQELKRVEQTGSSIFKDATTKSKLIGIGKDLKMWEKEGKANALLMLSHAILESQFGMSPIAQRDNNIFGLNIQDSDTGAGKKYASVDANIEAYVTEYLNKNYLPADGGYANGSHLGNKWRGINVRYASDPYWGQKAAGHAYRLDKLMGSKDDKAYELYEIVVPKNVNKGYVNVRENADTKKESLFRLKYGEVVAVTEILPKSDYTWLKILSNSNEQEYVYIAKGDSDTIYAEKITFE